MLAFLVVVGASFYVIAANLINLVGNYLYEQRINTDRINIEKLSVQIAPLLDMYETQEIQNVLQQAGGQLGGRLLIIDPYGKVQFDSYSELLGTRVFAPEVTEILNGLNSVGYGVHQFDHIEHIKTNLGLFSFLRNQHKDETWIAYCTAAIQNRNGITGVLLFLSPIHEMMADLFSLQDKMLIYFIAAAISALIAAMIFSRVITKPIIDMTRIIQKMGKGDLSVRAKVKGSGEIRRLAATFNRMSEKLEALDTSRNQFVANASHELKTPLATMKIMLESMIYQPDMDNDLRDEFMQDINNEIDRLSMIISDLLTLVQMDTHTEKLYEEPIDFTEIVRNAARKLMPMAQDKHQIITVNTVESCLLTADGPKLTQVVYNLVDNAIKYTQPAGQIAINLTKTNHEAILVVQDNGPGIHETEQTQIFDRFYRVDKARSRNTGGTGLGLAIVSQIVALHGGTISLNSKINDGSAFRVVIPFQRL